MEDREQIKFLSNVAVTIELEDIKGPYTNKDHPEWGKSWLVLAKQDGALIKFYAKEPLWEKIKEYSSKQPIRIIYAERTNKDGKTYHEWVVNESLFEDDGSARPEPPPSIENDEEAYEAYRAKRLQTYKDALFDALDIVKFANGDVFMSGKPEEQSLPLDHEDIRAIAISMAIDFQRSR